MKKTAIDWLIEQIKNDQFNKVKTNLEWSEIFKQAKELEKEQIINAYIIPYDSFWYIDAEQYYNEIYKLKQDEKDSTNGTDRVL
jgi:hypothetical protein